MKSQNHFTDRFFIYTALVGLIGVPAVFLPFLHQPFYLSKLLFFKIILAILLPCAISMFLKSRERRPVFHPIVVAQIIYTLIFTVSSLTSLNRNISSPILFETLSYSLFFFILYFSLPYDKELIFIKGISYTGTLIALYALLQHCGFDIMGIEFWSNPGLIKARSVSTLGSPLYLGGYLAMVIPLVFYLFIVERKDDSTISNKSKASRKSSHWQFIYGAMWAVCFLALLLTYSRGAILAAIIAHVVIFFFSMELFKKDKKVLLYTFLFVCSVILFLITYEKLSNTQTTIVNRIHQIFIRDSGLGFEGGRLSHWKISMMMVRDHLWLGSGPGMFSYVYLHYRGHEPLFQRGSNQFSMNPHNEFLHSATSSGIFGALAYLSIVVLFLYYCIRLIIMSKNSKKIMWTCIVASGIAQIINVFFLFKTISTEVLWLYILVLITINTETIDKDTIDSDKKKISTQSTNSLGKKQKFEYYATGLGIIISMLILISTFRTISGSYLLNKGVFLESARQWIKAEQYMKQAIAWDPSDTNYYLYLGELYEKRYKEDPKIELTDKAQEQYRKAINMVPCDPYAWAALGRIQALKFKATKDTMFLTMSINYYRKAIEIDPYNYTFYYELGNHFAASNDYNNAMEYFLKGLEANPNSHQLAYNIAVIYWERKDMLNARNYALKALSSNKSYDKALQLLNAIDQNEKKKKPVIN
ncbi:MAG: O-antigen ligase family protein [Candidatus Xenobiia bacterium LiM19]